MKGRIEYDYYGSGDGVNQIQTITNYNGYTEDFSCDMLDRLSSYTEQIESQTLTHSYSYTALDQLETMTYPSGLTVSYDYYDETGYLKALLDHNDQIIYEPKASNAYGQMTQYNLGNGITSQIDFDQFGIMDRIQTIDDVAITGHEILDMSFDIDVVNGLLNSRTDHVINGGMGLTETFTYDVYRPKWRMSHL